MEAKGRVGYLIKVFSDFERGLQDIIKDVSSSYSKLMSYAEELADRYVSDLEAKINELIENLNKETEETVKRIEEDKDRALREIGSELKSLASERFDQAVEEAVKEFWRRFGVS